MASAGGLRRTRCLSLVALAVAAALPCGQATYCTEWGLEVPEGQVMQASLRDPKTSAKDLQVNVGQIDRVISIPSDVESLSIYDAAMPQGGNFSNARGLKTLTLRGANLSTIDISTFPDSLVSLTLSRCNISSLKTAVFPPLLEELNIGLNNLTSIDFKMPKTLQTLTMTGTPLQSLDRVEFPLSIQNIILTATNISTIRGTRLPSSLTNLQIGPAQITTFEVRETDFVLLSKLEGLTLNIAQSACSEPTATRKTLMQSTVCVLTDARFAELYGGGVGSGVATPAPQATPSSSTTLFVIVGCAVGVVVLIAAYIGYRVGVASKQRRTSTSEGEANNHKFVSLVSDPSSSEAAAKSSGSAKQSTHSSEIYLTNDIRNDRALLPLRLDEREVYVHERIAEGGYGVVYRGVYREQHVAIKKMLSDTWRDQAKLARFMDEIRLCASMDHPKIVALKGITWTTVKDLAAVIEYMPGGDLHRALRRKTVTPSSRDWTEPWSSSHINPKALIALDIAAAVVYLHSFASPILHRDLKARNMLLDEHGNAKLSDFGISRELSLEETMTRGIGTIAWIAPEVLRGDRYSEKADIYSFGVLLVELDRCCDPYADQFIDGECIGDTQLAVLVCQGKLRPSMSATSPTAVRELADRCLSFDAESRPNAMALFYELHQVSRSISA